MAGSPSSLLLLFFPLFLLLLPHLSASVNREGLLLLRAKRSLLDPHDALSDWSSSDPTPCSWTGVTCGASVSPHSVTSLHLAGLGLAGSLPSRLPWILPLLLVLDLSCNNFSGDIPPLFSNFRNLRTLSLAGNQLSGPVPAFIAEVSTIQQLILSDNPFAPSPIPPTYKNLLALRVLWLSDCNIIGGIPPELGHLTELKSIDLSNNKISGEVPPELQNLKLIMLNLSNNQLSGRLPPLFLNSVYMNSFVGNPELSVDPTGQRTTKTSGGSLSRGVIWLLRVLLLLFALVLVASVAWFCFSTKNMKKVTATGVNRSHGGIVPTSQPSIHGGSSGGDSPAPVSC